MFWECTRRLGHDVVNGNVCRNVGFIQGKLSNNYYKCTDGWIKLVLRSTSFVVPHVQSLFRRRGVGKVTLLLQGEADISVLYVWEVAQYICDTFILTVSPGSSAN
jgi:hypothetical protein